MVLFAQNCTAASPAVNVQHLLYVVIALIPISVHSALLAQRRTVSMPQPIVSNEVAQEVGAEHAVLADVNAQDGNVPAVVTVPQQTSPDVGG
jgi:hypothetical protein